MDRAVLRIIDANLNRSREALRVLEDYARFVLDDEQVSQRLKALRHGLAQCTRAVADDAVLHRDAPGDVGARISADAERSRDDARHVVVAAGKRLGEALRSIEEYLKTMDSGAAVEVERLRYDFYDIEQRLSATLRPGKFRRVRLYVLLTESLCRRPWLEVAELALRGGADCIQLREKVLEDGELLRRARALVALCRRMGALCVINDRPDIAVLSGADGVHVGQEDVPATAARRLVGSRGLVGVSTHTIEQARQAVLDGADYIGVGPVFPSATKPRPTLAGLQYARAAAEEVRIPCAAVAGITRENVAEVLTTGVQAIAVSSAVVSAEDPCAASAELCAAIRETAVKGHSPAAAAGNHCRSG